MTPDRDAAGASGPLPAVGAGVIGGSTGGASLSDLRLGFTRCGEGEENEEGYDSVMPMSETDQHQGFLDRPAGWER